MSSSTKLSPAGTEPTVFATRHTPMFPPPARRTPVLPYAPVRQKPRLQRNAWIGMIVGGSLVAAMVMSAVAAVVVY